jgi:hypothetical protein
MPVDDPVSALEALNKSDERQRSPVSSIAKAFIQVVKIFLPPDTRLALDALNPALDWVGQQSQRNLSEFVAVLAEELVPGRPNTTISTDQ